MCVWHLPGMFLLLDGRPRLCVVLLWVCCGIFTLCSDDADTSDTLATENNDRCSDLKQEQITHESTLLPARLRLGAKDMIVDLWISQPGHNKHFS